MPNVIDLLKQDHRTVEQLFAQFESAQDVATAEEICAEIDVHAQAEEQVVYPALREQVSLEELGAEVATIKKKPSRGAPG
jgi:hemerythrin superfamily protein